MPRHASSFLRRAGLALAIGLGVAAAADAQPLRPDLDARLGRLGATLDLSAAQSSRLDAVAAQYADADRADLWAAAAAVQDVLTDAQVASLRQAADARRADRLQSGDARDGRRGPRADRMRRPGRRGDRGRGGRAVRGPELTEDQRAALREIRQETRQSAEALVAQLRAGSVSGDDFVDRTQALRDAAARRAAAVLPADVARRRAERRAARAAERAARESALDLSEAQKDALQSLRLDRLRARPARLDARPFLDGDGQLDRAAYRDALREQRVAARAAQDDRRDASADVLTEDQEALLFLHRVLAGRGSQATRRGGRGR